MLRARPRRSAPDSATRLAPPDIRDPTHRHPVPIPAMALDPELLAILVCPESKQPVSMAGEELLGRLNAAIEAGRAFTRAGDPVAEPVAEGLLREDGRILYAVREGIPIMLIDESIDISAL